MARSWSWLTKPKKNAKYILVSLIDRIAISVDTCPHYKIK